MSEYPQDEPRRILESYSETEPHHVFRLKTHVDPAQCIYEGYIIEVLEEAILFSWAPSPFDESDTDWELEEKIPIADIYITSILPQDMWVNQTRLAGAAANTNQLPDEAPCQVTGTSKSKHSSHGGVFQTLAAIVIVSATLIAIAAAVLSVWK